MWARIWIVCIPKILGLKGVWNGGRFEVTFTYGTSPLLPLSLVEWETFLPGHENHWIPPPEKLIMCVVSLDTRDINQYNSHSASSPPFPLVLLCIGPLLLGSLAKSMWKKSLTWLYLEEDFVNTKSDFIHDFSTNKNNDVLVKTNNPSNHHKRRK